MGTNSHWRQTANEVIVKIIQDNDSVPEKELRKKISDAYPFGQRAMHPYKIWCDAVAECLWQLRRIGSRPKRQTEDHNQTTLF